jgi:hypothetical protein
MRKELTFTELESENVELLPVRETLTYSSTNWAAVYATNSSMAFNAASLGSVAHSSAGQSISVVQS